MGAVWEWFWMNGWVAPPVTSTVTWVVVAPAISVV